MSPIAISLLVFASVFAGALIGLRLRKSLPEHHLSAESKDAIKLGAGLIGTMAALLLGLLVASAKNSYDTERIEVIQLASKFSFLDRILVHYGPEATEAREFMHQSVGRVINQMWPDDSSSKVELDPTATGGEGLY